MKARSVLLSILVVIAAPLIGATAPAKTTLTPQVFHAVKMVKTPPVTALPAAAPQKGEPFLMRTIPNQPLVTLLTANTLKAHATDPVVQNWQGSEKMPSPLGSFDGIDNNDNGTITGFLFVPPDTNGDVGPNHYVQIVNVLFQVFNKSGTPLTAPTKVSALFSTLPASPCATNDDGDPIVLYDHLADRWLISQFVFSTPSHECIAVSTTSNPAGSYFAYDFVQPNNKFGDYPKLGVWPDGYYMTTNQFVGNTFRGAGAYVFSRNTMLSGGAGSGIYFDLEALDPAIGGMLPSDLDGPAPPAGSPNYFMYWIADEFGDPFDGLRIFQFHADFINPFNSTFTERPESPIAVANFDPNLCNFNINCIPQPGTAARLDALSDRLMHRLQYRNRGTSESLVVTHNVDADGTDHAGVRYYQLRRTLPGGNFTVQDQATFAPDANNRWMGSAAMDKDGNLAVGYSVSSGSVFPSIRYAGRLASDPPNGLFQGEASLMAGAGSQTDATGRWGDYSALSVDPTDNCTFWYTNEYYTNVNVTPRDWKTRVGAFRFASCGSAPPPPPPVCSFSDDFQDGVVNPAKWSIVKPNVTENGGDLVLTPATRKAVAIASGFGGCGANCTIDTFMQTAGGPFNKVWTLAWFVDKKNTVEVLMKQENNKWILRQRINKSVVVKAKAISTINPNQDYHVVLTFDGATITLSVDNVTVASINPVGALNGTVGYQAKSTTGRFADLCVR